MVTEGDLTLGGKHTVQYSDDLLQSCTPETYIILLTNVTPINSINIFNAPLTALCTGTCENADLLGSPVRIPYSAGWLRYLHFKTNSSHFKEDPHLTTFRQALFNLPCEG